MVSECQISNCSLKFNFLTQPKCFTGFGTLLHLNFSISESFAYFNNYDFVFFLIPNTQAGHEKE